MDGQAQVFLIIGGLFAAGLLADLMGKRTRLPRVTLLLLAGLIFGRAGLNLIPQAITDWYEFLSVAALTMVAFLLGGGMTGGALAAHGKVILSMSLAIVGTTWALVSAGLWAIGLPPEAALCLGAIATATDPAATQDAITQADSPNQSDDHTPARASFATRLRGIVAIDDAWGIIVFSLALVAARALGGEGWEPSLLLQALIEIAGAVLLGLAIGLPAALITGRIQPGEPLRTEALALVFLTAGLSLWLDVSFLISGMVAGAVIAARARHHDYAFHEIENFEWPFLLLFFILAGATLAPSALLTMGLAGLGYAALRVAARIAGGWIGGRLAGLPKGQRGLFGLALLPQAGVAVGMALVAAKEFPAQAELILTVTIATTVLFEVIGPLATLAIMRRQ